MSDVATIHFLTAGGEAVEATLSGQGLWRGNDRALVDHLNDWYSPVGWSGPARGDFGIQEAELAASRFSGRLRLHRPPSSAGKGLVH